MLISNLLFFFFITSLGKKKKEEKLGELNLYHSICSEQ